MAFDDELDPLPITVPMALHNDMAKAVSKDFAVSYLCGAVAHAGTLHPRTFTASMRLRNNKDAMLVLSDHRLKLGDPVPEEQRLLIPAVEDAKRQSDRKRKW